MYLLFDIGGTKMRLAISKDGKSFNEPKIVPTPKDFKEGVSVFKKLASELAGKEKIEAAGGGIAGPLDKNRSQLVNSPNIPGWIKKPIKEEFSKAIGAKIYIENDADVVGLGEAVFGAGKGYHIVAYLTISTGVGGGRIVGGRIDENALGFEPGHQIIACPDLSRAESREPEVVMCPSCNAPGHLEGYISGTAIEKKYGKKPYDITDDKIWDETARFLAIGLNNTIVHWSPDIVVLGGSMMKKIGIPVERVRYHLKNILAIFPELPKIEKATLKDVGGLYGAMALLNQKLIKLN